MKRLLKISVLLSVSLFALVSGVDATLDQLNHSPSESSYTLYNEKGEAVVSYQGNLAYCKAYTKPTVPAVVSNFVPPRSLD